MKINYFVIFLDIKTEQISRIVFHKIFHYFINSLIIDYIITRV